MGDVMLVIRPITHDCHTFIFRLSRECSIYSRMINADSIAVVQREIPAIQIMVSANLICWPFGHELCSHLKGKKTEPNRTV